jgi:cbb3-type cytochrome oxidase maturation protein
MSVIYVLLPVAILFAAGALYLFVRAVRSGQYDDLDTPAVRMLHDDEGSRRREPDTTGSNDERNREEPDD